MSRTLKCYLDRFEGEYAVLLIDTLQVDFPRTLLPEGATEGDHLTLHLSIDSASREETAREISRIRQRLKDRKK